MTPSTRAVLIHACDVAYTHIFARTLADTTPEERQACWRDPEVRRLEAQVDAVSLTGDLPGTQALLQAVNRTYKAALARVRAQAEVCV